MSGSTGYGPANRLIFDGDESKYEQWECKLLAYLKIKKLKDIVLPGTIASMDRKEEAFAEIVQFLDDRSLSLVMRDAKDDGQKALKILRQHYAGTGKPRIISMYTALSTMIKRPNELLIDYILKAETKANSLRNAGEVINDGMLIAMILKGLPHSYKPFVVYITQSDKAMTFLEFKVAIRNYEENDRSSEPSGNLHNEFDKIMHIDSRRNPQKNNNNVLRMSNPENQDGVACFRCRGYGHKSHVCPTKQPTHNGGNANINNNNQNHNKNGKWCSNCKTSSHTDRQCRKQQQNKNKKDHANQIREENVDNSANNHTFLFHCEDEIIHDDHDKNEHSEIGENENSFYFNTTVDEINYDGGNQFDDEIERIFA